MKMDDCFQKVFSDEQIFVAQNRGSINGGRSGVSESESAVFHFKNVNKEM